MATTLGTLRTEVRTEVMEPSASFWTDAELLTYLIEGCKDLWRTLKDSLGDHFFAIDETVTMAAGASTLSNVPTNVAEVRLLEPKDLTTFPGLVFKSKAYNDPEFANARTMQAMSPQSVGVIYYAITGAGGPVNAPTIYVAPRISQEMLVRLMYVPNLGTLTADSDNPIPGEADVAVKAWCKSFALGKQNTDGSITPDPAWMEIYLTERDKVVTACTPRSTQEPDVIPALFEPYW